MATSDHIRNQLLAVIAVILVVAGLRATYAFTMPLAAAFVLVAAMWPVKPWLDRALPSSISYVVTILIMLVALCAFIAALYFSLTQVVLAFSQNQDQFGRIYGYLGNWASEWGIQQSGALDGYSRLISFGQMLLSNAYTVFVYLGFIAILVIFGLLEVSSLRAKISNSLTVGDRRDLIDTVEEIGVKIRRYLSVTVLTSFITGVASVLWAYGMGLELALVWGVLNFLLNFIPIIGNIIGIIPPSLYAFIQFESASMGLAVFAGFAVLQLVISNVLYPMLQGRSLALSPAAVLLSLAFWGWVWGVAGALLAVPLTAALVIGCRHFKSTRWIAILLATPE